MQQNKAKGRKTNLGNDFTKEGVAYNKKLGYVYIYI